MGFLLLRIAALPFEETTMSYLVFCTFDLKNASSQDYKNVYDDLAAIGLKKVHKPDGGGNITIPTTAAMGFFNAVSAASARDDISQRVQNALNARRLKSEIFVVVGGDWAWGSRTT